MATEPKTSAAAEGRFDEEGDWIVRQFFSPEDLQHSPEEYAARRGHLWSCFSYHRHRFRDPVLGTWVRRFAEILSTEGELERCRQQYLSPEELAKVRKQQAEDL